eukprot:15019435-Heterocapsa_arctica.AAC.1
MPTAAAAVAMAVPLGGLPAPSERETEQMFTAIVNGPRQTSANAEFRRKIKDNLMYRAKWDTWEREVKVKRAGQGCSRWYPGNHFPTWKFDVKGVLDPGRDGYVSERFRVDGWT